MKARLAGRSPEVLGQSRNEVSSGGCLPVHCRHEQVCLWSYHLDVLDVLADCQSLTVSLVVVPLARLHYYYNSNSDYYNLKQISD